mgnify:CR=1 FL=1
MSTYIAQAQLLMQRDRYDEAIAILQRGLGQNPEDGMAHALLGACLCELERYPEAREALGEAVRLTPDSYFPHLLLGHVYLGQDKLIDARRSADEAIRLSPERAELFALRAQIEARAEHWPEALRWADRGLARDPEHVGCANLRGMVLTQRGRRDEAREASNRSLAADPNDPTSHANQGWQLLHPNRPKEALSHFKEALRLEPGHEWAKAGLVEALKARNPIYRGLLGYILWMARRDGRTRMWLIIGGYLVYRLLLVVSREVPDLRPWLWPIIGAYIGFVLLTWVGVPLFNLIVRLNPHGRNALDKQSRISSDWFGGFALAGLIAALVAWAVGWSFGYALGAYLGVLAVTSGLSLMLDDAGARRNHLIVGGINAAVGAVALTCLATGNYAAFGGLATVFWITLLIFMFVPASSRQG